MIGKCTLNTALIVGLGSIGKRHLRLLRELRPDIKIVILRHQQPTEVDWNASEVHAVVYSIKDAIAHRPDFAIIANPSSFHVDISIALLKYNIHLLIEKPVSSILDDALRLIDVARTTKSKVMIGYNLRFEPSLIAFKKEIEAGRVGEVFSIRAEVGQHLAGWRPESAYQENVSAKRSLGGGVLLELSHELDYLSWIFGDPHWVSAFVDKSSSLNIDVEDLALVHLGFSSKRNGVARTIVGSLNMDFIRHDHKRECSVIGDIGTLKWDGTDNSVWFFSSISKHWEEVISFEHGRDFAFLEQLQQFFNCIEKNYDPHISIVDGAKVLRVVDAIHRSARDKSVCHLNQ